MLAMLQHPLAIGAYVTLALVLVMVVVGRATGGAIGSQSPSDTIVHAMSTAREIQRAAATDAGTDKSPENNTLRLAELSRAVGLVQAAQSMADQQTILTLTGVDVLHLLHELRGEAHALAAELNLTKDDVSAAWA